MGCDRADHGTAEPQGADRSQARKRQRDGADHFDHADHDTDH